MCSTTLGDSSWPSAPVLQWCIMECPRAVVLSAYLGRETFQDLSNLTTLHGIHLVHGKAHMLAPLNWSVAHFHFYWCSVALLYCCSRHPPGLRAPTLHMPQGAGYEVLQVTSIQPGNTISASFIAEPQGLRGWFQTVVLSW